ncbi:MAG: hypothetical protein H7X97_07860 [Opitutaceae bacterium]|nr:hypothetical protein [Verrucomicrobiales bacterium]
MKRAPIIRTSLVMALLAAAVATLRYVELNSAQPTREQSKMLSVELTTASALSDFFTNQGRYPGSLGELPLQALQWGNEGSSPQDLTSWSYRSDGSTFTMTWTNARGVELFLGGTTGRLYYSRDERR